MTAETLPAARRRRRGFHRRVFGMARFSPWTPSARRALLALLALLGLLLSGCMSQYPQTIFEPKSEIAVDQWSLLVNWIFWPALFVFVTVEGMLLLAAFRYRQRPGQARPRQIHGNTRIEIAWTIAPAAVLAVVAIPTVQTIFRTQAPVEREHPEALKIEVVGHQWWWEFRYTDLDVTTANEFWVPVGQTVGVSETSADVVHSFWVPAMGGKRDVVPNHVNHLWFTPSEAGEFPGQCAEFCGDSHANMRVRMFAVSPQEFQEWVARQKRPAGAPAPDAPDNVKQGSQLVIQNGCVGCHTIDGNPGNANAKVGPNLSHVGQRTTIAAGFMENNQQNLVRWVHNAPGVKPGVKMPSFQRLPDADVEAVAAYLSTLK